MITLRPLEADDVIQKRYKEIEFQFIAFCNFHPENLQGHPLAYHTDHIRRISGDRGHYRFLDATCELIDLLMRERKKIIDTPQPARDWSDVVEKLVKCAEETYETKSFFNENIFRIGARYILQQADKPAPVTRKVKARIDIYDDGNITANCELRSLSSPKCIAVKEIEIEYTEGEGLNE